MRRVAARLVLVVGLVACSSKSSGQGIDEDAAVDAEAGGGDDAVSADAPGTDSGMADGVGDDGSGPPSWNLLGLAGTTFRALAVDPKTPSTLYVGTSAAGIYRSSDTGATWMPIDTGLPSATVAASTIAVDPVTTSTLYVAVDGNGIFKSTNGGDSWSTTGVLVSTPESIVVDPATPSTLWTVGATEGVFKSVNGGGVWNPTVNTNLPVGSSPLRMLGYDPKTGTLFCGVDSLVLMQSTDGGDTWTSAATGLMLDAGVMGNVLAIAAQPSGTLFAQTAGDGLFKGNDTGSDGGASWAPVATMSNTGLAVLAIDPHDPSTIYVGAADQGILRSSDNGATWKRGGPPVGIDAIAVASDGTVYAAAGAGNGIWSRSPSPVW